MEMLENLILGVHVLAALAIIGLVLMQQGKGAEMGSGFGGGSSGTVFGSLGAGNFLTRLTTIAVIVFFVTSFSLAYFASNKATVVSQLGMPEMPVEVTTEQSDSEAAASLPETMELPEQSETESSDSELPEL